MCCPYLYLESILLQRFSRRLHNSPAIFFPSGDRSKDPGKRTIVAWEILGWDVIVVGYKSRLFYGYLHAGSKRVAPWSCSYCFEILPLTSWVNYVGLGGCGVSWSVWVRRTPMPWFVRCIAQPFWLHNPFGMRYRFELDPLEVTLKEPPREQYGQFCLYEDASLARAVWTQAGVDPLLQHR